MKVNKIWNSIKRHYQNILAAGLMLSMAAGWWGVLYPQLTLNEGTYRIVTEDGEVIGGEVVDGKRGGREADGTVVYMEMLNADRSQLRFRCRFVEEIMEYLERIRRE